VSEPIIAQGHSSRGERGTDGHVLTIEGRRGIAPSPCNSLCFNSIPYRIPMTDQYTSGHATVKGHTSFSNDTECSVRVLQAKFAGPDFDPSKINVVTK